MKEQLEMIISQVQIKAAVMTVNDSTDVGMLLINRRKAIDDIMVLYNRHILTARNYEIWQYNHHIEQIMYDILTPEQKTMLNKIKYDRLEMLKEGRR